MLGIHRISLALAPLVVLAGCATPPPPAPVASAAPPSQMLTNAELLALYGTQHREDGVVLHGGHVGAHWTKWVSPDGSLRLSAGAGLFTDTGHLVVQGDRVCSTWTHIDDGKQACMRVAKVAAGSYVTYGPNGVSASSFRVTIPGAPPDAF